MGGGLEAASGRQAGAGRFGKGRKKKAGVEHERRR